MRSAWRAIDTPSMSQLGMMGIAGIPTPYLLSFQVEGGSQSPTLKFCVST